MEDILIEDQTFLVNSNYSYQILVSKSECETQVPPNCPLWPINDPKEQYRSGYRLSKRQWNNPVNYPVGQAPPKTDNLFGCHTVVSPLIGNLCHFSATVCNVFCRCASNLRGVIPTLHKIPESQILNFRDVSSCRSYEEDYVKSLHFRFS